MRLPRAASLRRRIPVQPVTPSTNYTLARFTVGKSGLIIGHNRFGSRWFEIHFAGVTVLTWFAVNNNPWTTATTPKRNMTATAPRRKARVTA